MVQGLLGFLLLAFILIFALNFFWDRGIRQWAFKEKLDDKVEDAKEKYMSKRYKETLEETLGSDFRSPDESDK